MTEIDTIRILYEALSNLVPRFESACRHAGSDDEFIAEATARHRAALAATEAYWKGQKS